MDVVDINSKLNEVFLLEYTTFSFKLRSYSHIILHVIPGSGLLLVWVKVVSVLASTSYKWDASSLFLTRWQHFKRQWCWSSVVNGKRHESSQVVICNFAYMKGRI